MPLECTVPEQRASSLINDSSRDEDARDGSAVIRIRGKNITVPATKVGDITVVVLGKLLKIASVKDDLFLPTDPVHDPEQLVAHLRERGPQAHVFTFEQRLPDVTPKYGYRLEWENVAAVRTTDFNAWWDALPQETRKNARRAQKRGVIVKPAVLNDELVTGIVAIYNESALRQGKPFYHYGKPFETVKKELSTFSGTSEFIGAYLGDELIGFIKLVYMGPVASIMHIVSQQAHVDKRPTNALLAAAIAHCHKKGMTHLIYGSYTYGRKTNSSLAEFKRRNGFEQILIPRYYIPLTLTGRVILALNLHRGIIGILPPLLISALLRLRAKALEAMWATRRMLGGRPIARPEAY